MIVLSKSFQMNTNMKGLRWSDLIAICPLIACKPVEVDSATFKILRIAASIVKTSLKCCIFEETMIMELIA